MRSKYQKNKVKILCFEYLEFKELMKDFYTGSESIKLTFDDLAKFLGVTKILDMKKYNADTYIFYEDDMEDINTYHRIDWENRIIDASRALDNYFGVIDTGYDGLNPEELAEFKVEHGFDAEELYDENNDHYILDDLVSEFFEHQDSNVAENDTWDYVIKITLAKFKI